MSPAEVQEFLTRERTASIGTLGPGGSLHLVGMWYALLDGEIWFETMAKSQKVLNLRRDPRISCLVEAGITYDQLRGVSIEGRGEIVEDAEAIWRMAVDVFERYHGHYTEDARPIVEQLVRKRVAVRVVPDRVRSWDHRKLGLPTGSPAGSTAAFLGHR